MRLIAALLLLLAFTAQAARIEEDELEAQTREISKQLRCLVCQGENVWESHSNLAEQMRDHVRERLRAGESVEQIKTYLESRYGDFVLMEPPRHGLNWLLWLGPFALLIGGALLLRRQLSRWRTPRITEQSQPLNEEQKQRIETELARLEEE